MTRRGRRTSPRGGTRRRRYQVSDAQLEALITYMEQHLLFARGQVTRLGPQGHVKYQRMWSLLASLLNDIGPCVKDVGGWQRFWTKLRLDAKLAKATFIHEFNRTGHNPLEPTFNENHERISSIYGKYGTGMNIGRELGFSMICYSNHEAPPTMNKFNEVTVELQEISQRFSQRMVDVLKQFEEGIVNLCNSRKPIPAQTMDMINFMEQHHGIDDEPNAEKLWADMVELLNKCPGGCVKQLKGWQKCWYDLVLVARQTMNMIAKGKRTTPAPPHYVTVVDIVGGYNLDEDECEPTQSSGLPRSLPALPTGRKRPASSTASASEMNISHYQVNQPKRFKGNVSSGPIGTCTSNASATGSMLMPQPRLTAMSSARPSTSTGQASSAADKSSKLLKAIEQKAKGILDQLMGEFKQSCQNQASVMENSFQEQNRILLDNLPIIVRHEVSEILDQIPAMIMELLTRLGILTVTDAAPVNEESNENGGLYEELLAAAEDDTEPDENMANEDQVEEDTCPICKEKISSVKVLTCMHKFCDECITKWIRESRTCPVCRVAIPRKREIITLEGGVLTFNLLSDDSDAST